MEQTIEAIGNLAVLVEKLTRRLDSMQVTAPPAVPFDKAITELIKSKQRANRRDRYISSLGYYLRQFAVGRESAPLSSFTTADIETWMARYPGAYARQTWLNRLSTLFSFAVRRGHIVVNPCDRVERVTVDQKPPTVLTAEQSRKMLATVRPRCKPYLVLGMFAGIRPDEIFRMKWEDIDFSTKTAKVDGKTRRRRIVPLEPIAVELLKGCQKPSGMVAPHYSSIRRWKEVARHTIGRDRWPQDLLRHTAASYLLALYGDAGKVAARLGNSSSVLLSHYHEPVTQAECEKFWSLSDIQTAKN